MRIKTVTAGLIVAAVLGLSGIGTGNAATQDCSLPIGKLTPAQFEGCLHLARDPAKIVPLPIGEVEYIAPKPTTQRAYYDLLHAGD